VQLPEVIRVTRQGGEVTVARISSSTMVEAGEQILDDGAIAELFTQTAAVAEVWRTRVNGELRATQRLQTIVLDFEFKSMAAGWPQVAVARDPLPARLVLRQVRSLDPGLRPFSDGVRALPIPRDVIMRASLVETVRCIEPGGAVIDRVEVLTDPLLAPDMGHTDAPFVYGSLASPQATCTRTTHYASPDRALLQIVRDGGAFVIIG